MPYRKFPIVEGEIYHVFNRSAAGVPMFKQRKDYERAIQLVKYYRHRDLPLRFSLYSRMSKENKQVYEETILAKRRHCVEILAFCIMPNHVHFLLRPVCDGGISLFMTNLQHSYSKYFNTKYQRYGGLFQAMFKAVRIESEEQLLHVSRYIHLNPVTAYIITPKELDAYPWSSFGEYIENSEETLIHKAPIMNSFSSPEAYRSFVMDQVDYQRELHKIRHLCLE